MFAINKILTFIVNKYNKFLLLKGNNNDPQFHKSIWYTVTGNCESQDKTKEYTVMREIQEETGLTKINNIIYLNWIFKYNSLGIDCTEYVYISFVNNSKITLNEENVDYKWYNLDDFINKIDWFGNKQDLKNVLTYALQNKLYFERENIDVFNN